MRENEIEAGEERTVPCEKPLDETTSVEAAVETESGEESCTVAECDAACVSDEAATKNSLNEEGTRREPKTDCDGSSPVADEPAGSPVHPDLGPSPSSKDRVPKLDRKKRTLVFVGVVVVILIASAMYRSFYHEWSDATCTESRTCTICGKTDGEPLGHVWQDATCTEPKTCSVCGVTEGEALGHSFPDDGWVVDTESTCTVAGSRHNTCARCGEVGTEQLPLAAHTEGEWQIEKEATVNSSGKAVAGKRAVYCTVCGKKIKSEEYTLSAEEIESSFKGQCESPSYEDVARNPDDWEGHKVAFTGQVIQVMESNGSYTLRVNVTQGRYSWSDTILVSYTAPSGSGRILEDDVLTFYGTMNGMYSYKTVLGATMTVPLLVASYVG